MLVNAFISARTISLSMVYIMKASSLFFSLISGTCDFQSLPLIIEHFSNKMDDWWNNYNLPPKPEENNVPDGAAPMPPPPDDCEKLQSNRNWCLVDIAG